MDTVHASVFSGGLDISHIFYVVASDFEVDSGQYSEGSLSLTDLCVLTNDERWTMTP